MVKVPATGIRIDGSCLQCKKVGTVLVPVSLNLHDNRSNDIDFLFSAAYACAHLLRFRTLLQGDNSSGCRKRERIKGNNSAHGVTRDTQAVQWSLHAANY
jgi:hypothetical protein